MQNLLGLNSIKVNIKSKDAYLGYIDGMESAVPAHTAAAGGGLLPGRNILGCVRLF